MFNYQYFLYDYRCVFVVYFTSTVFIVVLLTHLFAIQKFHHLSNEKPALLLHCQVDGSSPKGGKVPGTPLWPSPNMAHSMPFTEPLLRMRVGNASGGLALFQHGEKRGGLPWLRSGLS